MNEPQLLPEDKTLLVHREQAIVVPLRSWPRRHAGSLLFIGLPTLLTAIYFFVFAADLYVSEARFVVRSPSRTQATGLAGLLQTSGINRSPDDVYSVQDFVTSRDAIAALQKNTDLRAIFARPEADFIARFPNFYDRDNNEDFFRYFKRRVEVIYDSTTGICTLVVKAFRPDDAQLVATRLLDAAEALVNRLNERARVNSVRDAEAQVQSAEDRITEAQKGVLGYRNREELLDPGKTSGAIFENLSKLQADLTASRLRAAELGRSAPDSPLRAGLQSHIDALDQQIASQRARLAGGGTSMAPKISEYEQLSLRQDFASKELAAALASLETARAEARRQQIYLDPVVSANLADKALYPQRFRIVFIVFITCFLAYSIGKLLIAGVREHAQD